MKRTVVPVRMAWGRHRRDSAPKSIFPRVPGTYQEGPFLYIIARAVAASMTWLGAGIQDMAEV